MNDYLEDYYDALERLVNGKAKRLEKSAKINNDNVSLEAGRKKGSIKKSRPVFKDLIKAIRSAKAKNENVSEQEAFRLAKARDERLKYKTLWEESLGREISLLNENFELKHEIERLKVKLLSHSKFK